MLHNARLAATELTKLAPAQLEVWRKSLRELPTRSGGQGAVLYWPPLDELFHTVPIPVADLLPIVAVASAVLWVEELRKLFVRPRRFVVD